MVDNTIALSSAKGPGLGVLSLANTEADSLPEAVGTFLTSGPSSGPYVLADLVAYFNGRFSVGGAVLDVSQMLNGAPSYDNPLGVAFTPWVYHLRAGGDGGGAWATPQEAYYAARDEFRSEFPDGAIWRILIVQESPSDFHACAVGIDAVVPSNLSMAAP